MESSLLDEVSRFRALGDRGLALVLPRGVNSYQRFRLHQTVREDFDGQLRTFSVGSGASRRMVLAWADRVRLPEVDEVKEELADDMPANDVTVPGSDSQTAAGNAAKAPSTSDKSGRKARRPDRQMYVPRQRRTQQQGSQPRAETEDAPGPKASLEEEIAAALAEGVTVVESDLPPFAADASSQQHFLTRWLDPEDAAAAGEEGDGDRADPIDPALVVELHGFDASLRTGDLARELSSYRGGFDLRWVDDTHALAVFKTAGMALSALADKFGKVKCRPLSEATEASKERASRLAAPVPPRPRPETSTLVARRMLGGALGVDLLSEGREKVERNKLQKARAIKNKRNSREEED